MASAGVQDGQEAWRFDFQDGFTSATFVLDGNKVTVIPNGGFPGAYPLPDVGLLAVPALTAHLQRVMQLLRDCCAEASYTFELPLVSYGAAGGKGGSGTILTPMPGRVVKVNAKAGDAVEAGATLMILEAMKMEVLPWRTVLLLWRRPTALPVRVLCCSTRSRRHSLACWRRFGSLRVPLCKTARCC